MADKAGFSFKKFLEKAFLEEETTPGTNDVPTEEDMQSFEATVTSGESSEDITVQAQAIIQDSQAAFDADEFPDISRVQDALNTAESDDKKLILRIITYGGFDPAGLKQDGINRRQAITDAIQRINQQNETLKQAKDADDLAIAEAESAAETEYTTSVTDINNQAAKLIEDEKRRSAEIIAGIRQKAEEDTAAAKKLREDTLEELSARRTDNDTARDNSAALAAAVEASGKTVISQIDNWMSYLE